MINNVVSKAVNFLKQNIREEPRNIMDACCGEGYLVRKLASSYPKSRVCGLDINWISLHQGARRGNFKRAIPICGDVYDLLKKRPKFRIVHDNPNFDGEKNLTVATFEDLKEPLRNFELVTTVNPSSELTADEMNKLIGGEKLRKNRGFVPIEVISIPADKGGHVFYEMEIANLYAGLYGGLSPLTVTERDMKKCLYEMRKEGEGVGLEYVSHFFEKTNFLGSPYSVDVAILFKKK